LPQPVNWDFIANLNPLYWTITNKYKSLYQGTQDIVTAELFNAGSQTESFSISDFQNWLMPNITSGQIPSGGNQIISFSISDQLNAGLYSDTIYANTANGDEPLYIDISVTAHPPDWTIIPGNYQYSMTIIAEVSIENSTSDDELDLLSAFVNDEIRGVSNFQYVSQNNSYLVFLTVYSNNISGEIQMED